jgi:dipeptidyl aminopeptidase/acylaminoacyl peptidase
LEEAFLVVINKDGSGRKIIRLPDAPSYWGLHISPTSTYVAYSAFRDSYQYNAELRVVRLTNGEVEAEIPLYANGWYETWKPEIGVMTDEVVRAVGAISWSPGGRYLAFVAAKDGSSSDLYLYDTSTREIRRLTDGPNQVEIMWWSPDGEWIVHNEVRNFGTGAGANVKAVWAAAADGSEVRYLYDAQRRRQVIVSWINSKDFFAYEEVPGLGPMNLVRSSIEGEQVIRLYTGPLTNVRFDQKHNIASFIMWDDEYEDFRQGVYIISLYGGVPELVLEGIWNIAWWMEMDIFVAIQQEGGIAGFDAKGEIVFRDPEAIGGKFILPAPNQRWIAVASSEGTWLLDQEGQMLNRIVKGDVETMFWGPDGLMLFVVVDREDDEILYAYDPIIDQLHFVDSDVPTYRWRYYWLW